MKPRYVILTNNELFSFVADKDWIHIINEWIERGYVPLGGCVHFGNTGLMQTLYLPIDEITKENIRLQAGGMQK